MQNIPDFAHTIQNLHVVNYLPFQTLTIQTCTIYALIFLAFVGMVATFFMLYLRRALDEERRETELKQLAPRKKSMEDLLQEVEEGYREIFYPRMPHKARA